MESSKVSCYNQVVGRSGEKYAVEFLRARGFEILARNYRCGKSEVDIVAQHGKVISFIEVKTRRTSDFGHPAEAVTRSKQREIAKVAEYYICTKGSADVSYRFDVVVVFLGGPQPVVELIEDAFRIF
jgi:putative endonuclease